MTDKGTDLESTESYDTYGLHWDLNQICGGF